MGVNHIPGTQLAYLPAHTDDNPVPVILNYLSGAPLLAVIELLMTHLLQFRRDLNSNLC